MNLGPGQGSHADIVSPVDGGHDIVAGDWMDRAWNLLMDRASPEVEARWRPTSGGFEPGIEVLQT